MKTRNLITVFTIAFFTATTMQAQEKEHDNGKHEHAEMKMDKPMYACLIHADEKSEKADECPKCGMKMEKMEMVKTYMCPMKCEGDKTYEQEGNCPKCGMVLKEMKMDKMKKEDDHKGHEH